MLRTSLVHGQYYVQQSVLKTVINRKSRIIETGREGMQGHGQRRLFHCSRFNFSKLTFQIFLMQKRSLLCKIQLLHRICDTFMHLCYHCSLEKFFFPCFASKGSGIPRTKGHIILQHRKRLLHIDLVFLRPHCKGIIQGRLSQL